MASTAPTAARQPATTRQVRCLAHWGRRSPSLGCLVNSRWIFLPSLSDCSNSALFRPKHHLISPPFPSYLGCVAERLTQRPWLAENVHTPAAQRFPPGATRKRPLIYV
jgi:hypothetical protein